MWGVGKLQLHGLCTHRLVHKEMLRNHRSIRDLTSGALEIAFVVIRLEVTRPKNTGFVCLLDFFFEFQIIPVFL